MEENRITIGQLARLNHISQQTLRLYDRLGLLVPAYTDPENHYRYYTMEQAARLDFIQYHAALGLTLSEIQGLLESTSPDQLRQQLERRRAEVRKELETLKLVERSIGEELEELSARGVMATPEEPELTCLPERRAVVYPCDGELLGCPYPTYQHHLHQFKRWLLEQGAPGALLHRYGRVLRLSDLKRGQFHCGALFLTIGEEPIAPEKTETFPGGVYLTACCKAFGREEQSVQTLVAAARRRQLQIVGDCLMETLGGFPQRADGSGPYCCRLSLPVR